jgi:hypothetical protein
MQALADLEPGARVGLGIGFELGDFLVQCATQVVPESGDPLGWTASANSRSLNSRG